MTSESARSAMRPTTFRTSTPSSPACAAQALQTHVAALAGVTLLTALALRAVLTGRAGFTGLAGLSGWAHGAHWTGTCGSREQYRENSHPTFHRSIHPGYSACSLRDAWVRRKLACNLKQTRHPRDARGVSRVKKRRANASSADASSERRRAASRHGTTQPLGPATRRPTPRGGAPTHRSHRSLAGHGPSESHGTRLIQRPATPALHYRCSLPGLAGFAVRCWRTQAHSSAIIRKSSPRARASTTLSFAILPVR